MSVLETIAFRVHATGPGLFLMIRFDGQEIYSQEPTSETIDIKHEFDDGTDGPHILEIKMSGKTRHHTKLDQSGKIIEDCCIEISDVEISGIVLGHMLSETAVYEHDTNGTTEIRQDRFFGTMGCNGTVRLEFSSPVYFWLLEHL